MSAPKVQIMQLKTGQLVEYTLGHADASGSQSINTGPQVVYENGQFYQLNLGGKTLVDVTGIVDSKGLGIGLPQGYSLNAAATITADPTPAVASSTPQTGTLSPIASPTNIQAQLDLNHTVQLGVNQSGTPISISQDPASGIYSITQGNGNVIYTSDTNSISEAYNVGKASLQTTNQKFYSYTADQINAISQGQAPANAGGAGSLGVSVNNNGGAYGDVNGQLVQQVGTDPLNNNVPIYKSTGLPVQTATVNGQTVEIIQPSGQVSGAGAGTGSAGPLGNNDIANTIAVSPRGQMMQTAYGPSYQVSADGQTVQVFAKDGTPLGTFNNAADAQAAILKASNPQFQAGTATGAAGVAIAGNPQVQLSALAQNPGNGVTVSLDGKSFSVLDPYTGQDIHYDNANAALAAYNKGQSVSNLTSQIENAPVSDGYSLGIGNTGTVLTVKADSSLLQAGRDDIAYSIVDQNGNVLDAQLNSNEAANYMSNAENQGANAAYSASVGGQGGAGGAVAGPKQGGIRGLMANPYFSAFSTVFGGIGLFASIKALAQHFSFGGFASLALSATGFITGLSNMMTSGLLSKFSFFKNMSQGKADMYAIIAMAAIALAAFLIGKYGSKQNQSLNTSAGDTPGITGTGGSSGTGSGSGSGSGTSSSWWQVFQNNSLTSGSVFLIGLGVTALGVGISFTPGAPAFQSIQISASQLPTVHTELQYAVYGSSGTGATGQLPSSLLGKVFVYPSGDGLSTPDQVVYVSQDGNGDGGYTVNKVSLNYNGYLTGASAPSSSQVPFFLASSNGSIIANPAASAAIQTQTAMAQVAASNLVTPQSASVAAGMGTMQGHAVQFNQLVPTSNSY